MTKEKLGSEPAFPECKQISDGSIVMNNGMSKRFYAACAAMQGILSNSSFMESLSKVYPTKEDAPKMKTHLIILAYGYSDELLRHEKL